MPLRRIGSSVEVTWVPLEKLALRAGADVVDLPSGSLLVLKSSAGDWQATVGEVALDAFRLRVALGFLDALGEFAPTGGWWAVVAVRDGWREGFRLDSDEAPAVPSRARPQVLAYGRHVGDESAVLLPEAHYLHSRQYLKPRLQLWTERRPWTWKSPSAVYAGGAHGSPSSFLDDPAGDAHPRARLHRLAAGSRHPLLVSAGGPAVTRRGQLAHQVIVDLDGHARTWDAWHWKMLGGSVVLTPDSVWETFFTAQFTPWEHFVPMANDLGDLDEQLDWCFGHAEECRRIAARARRRAREVYAWAAVKQRAIADLSAWAVDPGPDV